MSRILSRRYPASLIAAAAGVSLATFDRLPPQIAVHWDLDGNPNGWMPRAIGAFAIPVMLVVLWGVLGAVPLAGPQGEKSAGQSAYDVTVAAVLTLLVATHLIVLANGLGFHVPVVRIASATAGALFVVIGNVMPVMQRNFTFGVRTPWTLSSERVWIRTHRLAGYTITGAGLLMIAASLLAPADLAVAVTISCMVGGLVAPVFYSYLTWKRETRR